MAHSARAWKISGSPPRVRGTALPAAGSITSPGITPACAGNRHRAGETILPYWDHPRVCGEQLAGIPFEVQHSGSPPRVRGTVVGPHIRVYEAGITPACAGNRRCLCSGKQPCRDHPRVCGEQGGFSCGGTRGRGSPPRVRGTGYAHRGPPRYRGITPACAGNSAYLQSPAILLQDHPRVCGEQLAAPLSCGSLWGSPPRVRGTVYRGRQKKLGSPPRVRGTACIRRNLVI